MNTARARGFTLIELLVVIAIIGILASIILVSLGSARNKGKDANVQGQMSNLRTAGELFASNNGSYGTVPTAGGCGTGSMFLDTTSNAKGIVQGIANTINSSATTFTNMDCGVDAAGLAWSMAVKLPSGSSYWCVDSNGTSRGSNSAGTAYNGVTTGTAPAHAAAGGTVCN